MTRTSSDLTAALVALSMVRLGSDTKGPRAFQDVLWAEVCRDSPAVRPTELLARLVALVGTPPDDRPRCIAEASRRATRALVQSEAAGLTVLSRDVRAYPSLLAAIPDPPIVLWVRGQADVLARPAVAIVGSRHATAVGAEVARQLGAGLAGAGLVVVSGLARGVDAAAHRGALEAGGVTVGVLGCGVDVPYPRPHVALAASIAARGAVVAEFPPETLPYPAHFPLRNRIISGLALATVVIEASDRSGSLITARLALEQGREVLAVPGNVLSGSSRGCHALIKDGAGLVETVEDVLSALGWTLPAMPTEGDSSKSSAVSDLDEMFPAGTPLSADELALRTGRPVAEWLAQLGALEVAGRVERTPGGLFLRLDGPATNRGR